MIGNHFSLILPPTNKCNVACEYCFEDKTSDFMSLEQLSILIEKALDHMDNCAIPSMTVEEIAAKTASDRRWRSLPVLRTRA